MSISISERRQYLTAGELREEIAYAVGGDPSRYGPRSSYGLKKATVRRVAEQLASIDDCPAPKVRNRAEGLTDSVAEERGSVSVIEPGHVFDPTIASPGLKVCPRGQEGDLLDAAVGDGTVLVLPALDVPVFDEVFEPVADGTSARVVLVFELHDEVGNHVTAVGNHLFEEFVRQRRLSRSRHTLRCNFGHHNVDHTGNNHSSCPRGEELCIVGHTDNNMEATA
jgi:hypothetical protein